MSRTHVVILGGGFAGLRVARNLSKSYKIDVTLITDSTTFRYSPALYRSATGFRMRESIIPISKITEKYSNLDLIRQKVESIDRQKKTVKVANGKTYKYDYAVICLGVVTSYFGIPGLEKYSFNIKSPEGLLKLKSHLHKTLIETGEPDANYVVVGGGPTGVELSASLAKYLRHLCKKHKVKKHAIRLELVEAAPRVLPILSERASRLTAKRLHKLKVKIMLNTAVKAETEETLKLPDRSLPTRTVIWTAGVTNNPFFKENISQFTLNERGKVVVNEFMQIDNHAFVIGDNAGTRYGGLAQTAIRDANYVSKAIKKLSKRKKIRPYRQKSPVGIVPAGENWSVLQYKGLVLSGKLPALLRSIADLVGYADIMGLSQAFGIWRRRSQSEEICKICSSSLKEF